MIMKVLRSFSILAMTGCAAAASACSHSGGSGALPLARTAAQRSAQHVTIEEFADLPNGYGGGRYFPTALTATANALWVADNTDQDGGNSVIARIGMSAKRSRTFHYQVGVYPSFEGVAKGSDGALWLTDTIDFLIVRATMHGKLTTYPSGINYPQGIVAAPDGALWFTGSVYPGWGAIGRITTGGAITSYTKGFTQKFPRCITVGSDGALWFTEPIGDSIGRISLQGKVTQYSKGISTGSQPYSIAPGPDGALWFTELKGGRIGRITTDGTVTEYSRGITSREQPNGIAAGPDDAMWFAESKVKGSYHYYLAAKVGRITMSGKIVEYTVPTNTSDPTAIVAGPDGNMWFVETNANRVGRVDL